MKTGLSFRLGGQSVELEVDLFQCAIIGEGQKRAALIIGGEIVSENVQFPLAGDYNVFISQLWEEGLYNVLLRNGIISEGVTVSDIGPNDVFWKCEIVSDHVREIIDQLRGEDPHNYLFSQKDADEQDDISSFLTKTGFSPECF